MSSLNITSDIVQTTLPFLQNFAVTTQVNSIEPTKNPRWSKGFYSWIVLKIRAQKCLDHLGHPFCHIKLTRENIDINNKKVLRELEKCLQGVQGSPNLHRVNSSFRLLTQ